MTGAVRRPCFIARLYDALDAIVIVDSLAFQNEIAFSVAMMLMVAKRRTGGNSNPRVESALVSKLLIEDFFYQNGTFAGCARHGHCTFHKFSFSL